MPVRWPQPLQPSTNPSRSFHAPLRIYPYLRVFSAGCMDERHPSHFRAHANSASPDRLTVAYAFRSIDLRVLWISRGLAIEHVAPESAQATASHNAVLVKYALLRNCRSARCRSISGRTLRPQSASQPSKLKSGPETGMNRLPCARSKSKKIFQRLGDNSRSPCNEDQHIRRLFAHLQFKQADPGKLPLEIANARAARTAAAPQTRSRCPRARPILP
jgi:hypothetical protein